MELDYERDLFIDESALDVEWLTQPSLMMKYTKESARLRKEVDRLKEKLTVVKAELDHEIRSNPDDFDLKKVTDAVVANCLVLQDKHKQAVAELIDAQYESLMAQGAVQAVDQRKQALENLSRLLGLQYFAGPRTPRDLPKEVQEQQEKKRINSTIKISRRK